MEAELPPEPETEPAPATETVPQPTAPAVIPTSAVPAPQVPTYRDRSTGLVVFGAFQIILGLLAALMVPLAALGAFMSRITPGGPMRPAQYISSIATYAFIAAALIGLGSGSVQMKRWAYALTLVISWYWLIIGVLITILLTAVLPVTMRGILHAQQNDGVPSGNVPTGVMAAILTVVIVFFAFFLVIVPIAFVVFYSNKDVEQTCHYRDPFERWTDRAPLPVLGATVALFTGALYMLLIGVTTPIFPFFGRYLTGIPGAVCFLGLGALDLYLAIALFRLQFTGWWIAVITVPIRLLSMVLTYARADLMQAYSKMGWSDAQLKILNASPMFRSHVILWWSLTSMVLFFGFLLWLKRYFRSSVVPPAVEALPAPMS